MKIIHDKRDTELFFFLTPWPRGVCCEDLSLCMCVKMTIRDGDGEPCSLPGRGSRALLQLIFPPHSEDNRRPPQSLGMPCHSAGKALGRFILISPVSLRSRCALLCRHGMMPDPDGGAGKMGLWTSIEGRCRRWATRTLMG